MKKNLFLSCTFLILAVSAGAQLPEVTGFGANPGNLRMYKYVPANMMQSAPLVLVIHGCTQSASGYDYDSDWQRLAEKYKFYLVYAEQQTVNDGQKCFSYYNMGDISREQGETQSIKQMVDKMKADYSIDEKRVFVTGFSAGGIMTSSQLASYPDVYAAGAVMAGFPFKCITSSSEALPAVQGKIRKTPQQWGDLVRNEYPAYTGPYPRVGIFHGTKDANVHFQNAIELTDQWTNVHGIDTLADAGVAAFDGNASVKKAEYRDAKGMAKVVRLDYINMAHGIAVNPGITLGCREGGHPNTYSIDLDHYSSYWVADFFGLIPANDCSSTDIEESGARNSFSIFPNPCHGELTVSGSMLPDQLNLYTVMGEKIKNLDPEIRNIKLNLPPGVYILEAATEEGIRSAEKFIVR